MTEEFDPLDYVNLTKFVVETLMASANTPLPLLTEFDGAGVYALFYTGTDPLYAEISAPEPTHPIYVGKAVPPGGRKGSEASLMTGLGAPTLYKRLVEHRGSLDAVDDLDAGDFVCRYLVVKPVWIVMAERFLISHYTPVWNSVLDGFGQHDPGSARTGRRSKWDTVHRDRTRNWTATVKEHHNEAAVRAEVRSVLSTMARVAAAD